MLATLLLATAALTAAPPVAVRLNNDGRFEPGDGVRVTVSPGGDGYLVVLHADPDGRIRVLFPLDPFDDAFVRGGRDYDLRTRGDRRELFIADWQQGNGTVLAALSSDPLQVGGLSLNGHWDYRLLQRDQTLDDETALRTVIEQLVPGGGFSYDVVPYVISGFEGGMAGAGGTTVVSFGVGVPAWGVGWVDPWWGWGPGWGWGVGWGWGWAGFSPWWGWGPAWGWGPGWGCCWGVPVAPGWPAYGAGQGVRVAGRTWNGQSHPAAGGGIGVSGGFTPNPGLANGSSVGYRPRGDGIGVSGSLEGGRRRTTTTVASSSAPSRSERSASTARRLAGGEVATASDYYRGAPANGRRGEAGRSASGGTSTYGRRTFEGGDPGGARGAAGSRSYDGRGSSDGSVSRGPSGGSRGYSGGAVSRGYSGGSRGYTGGSVGRGYSGGFSGGARGGFSGGARGGGYRGR